MKHLQNQPKNNILQSPIKNIFPVLPFILTYKGNIMIDFLFFLNRHSPNREQNLGVDKNPGLLMLLLLKQVLNISK